MSTDDVSTYLKLSQFLELEGQWLGAADPAELCHRVCRTAAMLLDTPDVAIGLEPPGKPYALVAAEGSWQSTTPNVGATAGLLHAARTTGTAQLKSTGDQSAGVFPFKAANGLRGCLQVRVPRPAFRVLEISFLRFLASLCAIIISGGAVPSLGAEQADRNGPHVRDSTARRYVAMAVHDLRNPLNVIAGYAALLQDESLGSLNEHQSEAIDAIGRQVQVLLSAVDQLIELHRMSGGVATQATALPFDVRGLFDDVRTTCFPNAGERVAWPGHEAGFDFCGDRRRVFSIVQNLVDNALKHTDGGPVAVDCTRANGHLTIEVKDHGPGLDAELRHTLTSHAQSGIELAPRSGLGLYTVATYVHALRGTAEIECPQGGGTLIRVRIPTTETREAANGNRTPAAIGMRHTA
jgi:signal transduction histidine kinase